MPLRAGLGILLFGIAAFFSSPAPAQLPLEGAPIPLSLGSSAGVRSFREGRWGVVGVEIANPRDHDVQVQATFFFTHSPEVQFGRLMWVPANSKRIAHCPLVPSGSK